MNSQTPRTPAPGPLTKAIADVLAGRARTERLTQKQLAAASGIEPTSLQRYLAGRRHINVDNLAAMAKALNTTAYAVTLEAQRRVDAASQGEVEPDEVG